MIRHLKVIKESLKNKKLCIWDVGKAAIWTFSAMAERGLNIHCFVTNFPEYIGDTIMNRPVVSPEEFREEKDAVLITSAAVSPGTFQLTASFGEAYRWPDALEWNPLLKEKPVYLWGTGSEAWEFIKTAGRSGISVCGILEENGSGTVLSLPVLDPSAVTFTEDDRVVVLEDKSSLDSEALARLQELGFRGTKFLRELTPGEELPFCDPYPMLDRAMKEGKRILFCCEEQMGGQIIRGIFKTYGVPLAREVSFNGVKGDLSDDIWSLADEDPSESVVLIYSPSVIRRCEIADAVNDLGYSAGAHNYAGTGKFFYNRYLPEGILAYEKDKKVEYSIDYTPIGGLPGWRVYGDADAETRIMILGGSTSSEVYYPECWASKLYRKICDAGKSVRIFNGAHEGNAVFEELNRMLRDIRELRPHIVISMSGYNDMARPGGKFDSVRSETQFEYWRRYESYMKQIAESEGAAFYAFLQPVNQTPGEESLYEAMMYLGQIHHRSRSFTKTLREDDFYCSLFSKFLHRDECFIDQCHYSDQGNEEIAGFVYDLIKDNLK